ncbi:MAG: hypothetical protein UT86_C0001G0224 [Candidatus Magasanikbacteria bacterium GW2011_GWC2_40_17]|uniref:Uncharacterized protein n=1 Tax=Candidatus Magasanikbacteria bacterium GW2011_GWA2_42_32 TaxID=1619039 RepID=A0A0G1A9E3_9BACT|nr:MAG: hypothetical protein UT86_C0001G0224 [Candidatus Magasanikbacteria bacterium GW2011_GWC2_40_17]KKS57584.1 MAG: hypothetical protein UV20_C0001G0224 [Candidatus Magasanikbacteria bacterium GW2011_GWA2_42_32]
MPIMDFRVRGLGGRGMRSIAPGSPCSLLQRQAALLSLLPLLHCLIPRGYSSSSVFIGPHK